MVMKLYAIYDYLAGNCQGSIFEQPNDACAIRAVRQMVANSILDVSQYELICIGSYDTEKPSITPLYVALGRLNLVLGGDEDA